MRRARQPPSRESRWSRAIKWKQRPVAAAGHGSPVQLEEHVARAKHEAQALNLVVVMVEALVHEVVRRQHERLRRGQWLEARHAPPQVARGIDPDDEVVADVLEREHGTRLAQNRLHIVEGALALDWHEL